MSALTRRRFLAESAVVAGGALAAASVGGGVFNPSLGFGAASEFLEFSCDPGVEARGRVLVAYASYCGTTGEVARAIGKALCDQGASADVRSVEKVGDLRPYDAVIIGSAIHRGEWLPKAARFVAENRQSLSRIPVAYFLACLTLARPTEENLRKARSFLNPLLESVPEVRPIDIGLFGGVLDYAKLSFIMRTVMKHKMTQQGIQEGDYRDWVSIGKWESDVAPKLLRSHSTPGEVVSSQSP